MSAVPEGDELDGAGGGAGGVDEEDGGLDVGGDGDGGLEGDGTLEVEEELSVFGHGKLREEEFLGDGLPGAGVGGGGRRR